MHVCECIYIYTYICICKIYSCIMYYYMYYKIYPKKNLKDKMNINLKRGFSIFSHFSMGCHWRPLLYVIPQHPFNEFYKSPTPRSGWVDFRPDRSASAPNHMLWVDWPAPGPSWVSLYGSAQALCRINVFISEVVSYIILWLLQQATSCVSLPQNHKAY